MNIEAGQERRNVATALLIRVTLGLLSTAVFVGLLLVNVDLKDVADSFADANYVWIAPALLVHPTAIALRAKRWQILLTPVRKLPFLEIYRLILIGYMANNLLPARAGELVRVYITGTRWQISKMAVLGTIAVERSFDGIALMTMLFVVGTTLGVREILGSFAIVVAALIMAALITFIVVLSSTERAEKLLGIMLALAPQPIREKLRTSGEAFLRGVESSGSARVRGTALTMTTIIWLLEGATYYFVGQSFGLEISFPVYLLVVASANLAFAIPLSQGGIGPFEFFARQTLVLVGVASSLATAYAISLHALLLVPYTILGLYLLWTVQFSLGDVLKKPLVEKA